MVSLSNHEVAGKVQRALVPRQAQDEGSLGLEALMAWYRSFYHCGDCGTDWEDEWSCCCDDECPECGSGDWSPVQSEDLSVVVEVQGSEFVVLHSPAAVEEERPRYRAIAHLPATLVSEIVLKALRA